MTLVHWDDVEGFDIPEHLAPLGGRWQRLADAAGGVRVGAQRVLVAPAHMITPPHTHSAEEEIFHVLMGSATLWQDGTTCTVAAGDTIVHRPGSAAHTLVAGDGGLEVLVFGTRLTPESGPLPRTGVVWLADRVVPVREGHPWEAEAALGIPDGVAGERPENVVALDDVEGDFDGRWKRLGSQGGATRSGLNWAHLAPGEEGAYPHCHSLEEEVFVILDGEGVFELWGPPVPGRQPATEAEERFPVRRGHVIARPGGTRRSHCLRTEGASMTYLAYGTRDANDICYYPRSNKLYFRGVGLVARLDAVEYADGEPG